MKRIRLIVALCMLVFATQAQEKYFMDGLLPDDGTYDKLPAKKELGTKGIYDGYANLPKACSLKQYCPAVKSQANHSTCTGWASGYAARSIAEAARNGWTDRNVISAEAFSPVFVYALIKGEYNDPNCSNGSHIHDALKLMKEVGDVKYVDFDYLCAVKSDIDEAMLEKARQHRLDDYSTLFNLGEKDANKKVRAVKKSLSENCPVIIAMWLDKPTFSKTKSLLDLSTLDASFPLRSKSRGEGYHAMCVVGYDDNLQGGAFEIMNSWGTDWGNEGFFWVKYADFARTVDQAFEVVVNPLPKPLPEPDPEPEPQPLPVVLNEYAASIEMRWSDGGVIKPMLVTNGNMCCYQLYGELHSGDRLRMYISNNEQAYVYVFSSDLTNSVEELFPRPYVTDLTGKKVKKEYNPHLNYRSQSLVLPSEEDEDGKLKLDHSIRINDTNGMEYWCVLYSKVPLDFDAILDKVKSTEGTFYKKVKTALGDKMVRIEDTRFVMNRIEFSAKSEQEIVPIIIEAVHN